MKSFLLYCFYKLNMLHKPKYKVGDIVIRVDFEGFEEEDTTTFTILDISKNKRLYKVRLHGYGSTTLSVAYIDSECRPE